MNLKNFVEQIFQEIVYEYENEKMIKNGGFIKKTTALEILGGTKNV